MPASSRSTPARPNGLAGVRAVHVITETVGGAVETESGSRRPRRVLYVGAPVAAVAAVTPEAAEAALRLIDVKYEVLPFVVDMEDARKAGAPLVFQGPVGGESFAGGAASGEAIPQHGNVRGPSKAGTRGDVEEGFAEADVVVEGEYRTQVQTHCCMEPHGIVADWRADGLTVYMSTQFTAGVRNELGRCLRAAAQPGARRRRRHGRRIRLEVVGAAITRARPSPCRARRARRCASCSIGARSSSTPAIGRRPSSACASARARDGTLTAISLYTYGTAGTALGAGVGNIAQAMYDCPNFDIEQYDVFINAGPGCACARPATRRAPSRSSRRSTSWPKSSSSIRSRCATASIASPVRREERRIGAERIGWSRAPSAGRRYGSDQARHRHGAIALGRQCADQLVLRGARCCATARSRCCRACRTSAPASARCWRRSSRRNSGLRPQDITVRIGDTDFPAGPPSYGSRTTASITPPARNAAYQVKQALFRSAAPRLQAAPRRSGRARRSHRRCGPIRRAA